VPKFNEYAEFQFDVLKEVGNIGAGNATTALSKMLNKPVDMKVPLVKILQFEEITEIFGGSEEVVIGIFLRVVGEAPGNMFFIITQESAKKLLRHFVGIEVGAVGEYSEMELSALSEIGNILAGSYLSSLADFTKLNLYPTVPSLSIDMAGAILGYGLIQFGEMGEQALFIDTMFLVGNDEVKGHFFLIPDPDSLEKIFSALGVSME
jgi:chemotaxis protein CheC